MVESRDGLTHVWGVCDDNTTIGTGGDAVVVLLHLHRDDDGCMLLGLENLRGQNDVSCHLSRLKRPHEAPLDELARGKLGHLFYGLVDNLVPGLNRCKSEMFQLPIRMSIEYLSQSQSPPGRIRRGQVIFD